MIKHPTVFVVGAGASVDAGYPTGPDLVKQIYLGLEVNQPMYAAAIQAGFPEDSIIRFRDALHDGLIPTIDGFLKQRPNFRSIGKFAIAFAIISQENERHLKQSWRTGWFQHLRLALGHGLDDLRRNRVKFITFNYDRSLIHSLYLTFSAVAGDHEPPEVVRGLMANLAFTPIHGVLSPLPWQSSSGDERPYGATRDADVIKRASEKILIADEKVDSYGMMSPQEMIKEAAHVIYLGFGFDQKNMEKIGVTEYHGEKTKIFAGSILGLDPRRASEMKSRYRMKEFGTIAEIFTNSDISIP